MTTIRTALLATGALVVLSPAGAAAQGHGHGHAPAALHAGSHGRPAGHGRQLKRAVFQGTVVSADATAGTLVVHVLHANHWGHGQVGSDVTFDASAARVRTADGRATLADVAAGDRVVVQGLVARDGTTSAFTADRVLDGGPAAAAPGTDATTAAPGADTTATTSPGAPDPQAG